MSAPYVTRPAADRQLEAIHHNLAVADRQYMAHFESAAAKVWGIDEKIYEPDRREGTIHADLTLIITLKDRRNKLNRDDMNAVARRELANFVNCKGEWSKGRRPDIFDYDDPEMVSREVYMLSRSMWVAHITIYARYEDAGLPAGYAEWASSRGV